MHATNDAGSTMVLVKTCESLEGRQFEQMGLKLGLKRGDVGQP